MAAELKPSSFPPILHVAARRICPLTKSSPAHTHIRTYTLLGAPKANLLILPFRAPKSDGRRTPLRHLAGAHVPWAFLPCRAGFRGFLCPACPPFLPFPAPHLPLGHRVPIGHSESCPFVQFTLSRTHSLPADFCLNCLLTLQIPLVTKNKSGQRHQERLCSEEPSGGRSSLRRGFQNHMRSQHAAHLHVLEAKPLLSQRTPRSQFTSHT